MNEKFIQNLDKLPADVRRQFALLANQYGEKKKQDTIQNDFFQKYVNEIVAIAPRTECLETPIKDPTKETHNNGYYNWNNWNIEVDETRQT